MAEPDPRDHLHQQGRGRDARAPRRPDRPGRPAHVGVDLPLRLRAHPAPRRQVDRPELRVLDLRHGRLRAARQAHRRRPQRRSQALHAARDPRAHLRLQEQPSGLARRAQAVRARLQARPARLPDGPVRQRRGAVCGDVRRIPVPPRRRERGGLRRSDRPHRRAAARRPDGRRLLPPQVPLHPRRRVPGHEPRAVRARARARRGRGRRSARRRAVPDRRGGRARRAGVDHRGRRFRPVDLRLPRRRHPQHPGLRAGLPEREDDHARAELPLHADDPRRGQRGDRP